MTPSPDAVDSDLRTVTFWAQRIVVAHSRVFCDIFGLTRSKSRVPEIDDVRSLIEQRQEPNRHIAVLLINRASIIMAAIPEVMSPIAEVTSAMENTTIEPKTPERAARGTSVKLSVPIDESTSKVSAHGTTTTTYPSRKLARRDSLDRREALLKGKEGSRQRRRWENGKSPIPS